MFANSFLCIYIVKTNAVPVAKGEGASVETKKPQARNDIERRVCGKHSQNHKRPGRPRTGKHEIRYFK